MVEFMTESSKGKEDGMRIYCWVLVRRLSMRREE